MTDKIRRRQIQIETHEIMIVRKRGNSAVGYCNVCQSMVTTLSLDETVVLLRGSVESVLELTNGDEIHFTEKTGSGLPMICGNSLGNKK